MDGEQASLTVEFGRPAIVRPACTHGNPTDFGRCFFNSVARKEPGEISQKISLV